MKCRKQFKSDLKCSNIFHSILLQVSCCKSDRNCITATHLEVSECAGVSYEYRRPVLNTATRSRVGNEASSGPSCISEHHASKKGIVNAKFENFFTTFSHSCFFPIELEKTVLRKPFISPLNHIECSGTSGTLFFFLFGPPRFRKSKKEKS